MGAPPRPPIGFNGGVKVSLPTPSPFLSPPGARNWGGPQFGGLPKPQSMQPNVRPLFNAAGKYQPPKNFNVSQSQPAPEDTAWFPTWYHWNALCRRCGKNIGWRYERGSSMFWVFE